MCTRLGTGEARCSGQMILSLEHEHTHRAAHHQFSHATHMPQNIPNCFFFLA